MAYHEDLKSAARRHLRAAQTLYENDAAGAQPGCRAVAGYIFGLAGELAVKQMMRESGLKKLPDNDRRDDPYYAHFPILASLLVEKEVPGRRGSRLRNLANHFQNWDTRMRYAPTSDIQDAWVDSWKKHAEELVENMEYL